MDYFKEKADEAKQKEEVEFMPNWASKENASYAAYKATEQLKSEKLRFIREHSRPTQFRSKKTYQITGREAARAVDISPQTLTQSSTYSQAFNQYLERVNQDLLELKEARIKQSKQSRSRGPEAKNKNELVEENKRLKARVKELEALNAKDQVEHSINMLSPEVRAKLFIKQDQRIGNVTTLSKK